MKVIKADLISLVKLGVFDVIVHGCNCFHIMGSGIALQIKREFPANALADKNTPFGDIKKLGTLSFVHQRPFVDVLNGPDLVIINAYTQFGYGSGRNADYTAIRCAFKEIANRVRQWNPNLRIGYPKIGAGLAGGDWRVIEPIIEEELEGLDHTLVVLDEPFEIPAGKPITFYKLNGEVNNCVTVPNFVE